MFKQQKKKKKRPNQSIVLKKKRGKGEEGGGLSFACSPGEGKEEKPLFVSLARFSGVKGRKKKPEEEGEKSAFPQPIGAAEEEKEQRSRPELC